MLPRELSQSHLVIVIPNKCTVFPKVQGLTKLRKSKLFLTDQFFIYLFNFFRYCSSYYNLSTSFNQDKPGRAAGFGIGERIQSGRKSMISPDVGRYNLKS
tara:strand:+ start:107 stop:406 length:300 start_codon:yes stop_codon:yes gene_type:complete